MLPQENKLFPGYYDVPGYQYAISQSGELIDTRTGRQRSFYESRNGYYRVTIKVGGKEVNASRHRLMLYTFKPIPNRENSVGNHKNGIKGDDRLSNLEWTSQYGNLQHASETNLMVARAWREIQVRCVYTGDISTFNNVAQAARATGLKKDGLLKRVKDNDPGRVYPEGKQYRATGFDQPWPVPEDIESAIKKNGRKEGVFVRNLVTGEVKEFRLSKEAAQFLGVRDPAISMWLKDPLQKVHLGEWQLKANEKTPWREVKDLQKELFESGQRVHVVTIDKSGNKTVYPRAIDCARAVGLKPTALNERLKSDFRKEYADGLRYGYIQKLQSAEPEMVQ